LVYKVLYAIFLPAKFHKTGDVIGGFGQVIRDEGIGNAKGIVPFLKRVKGSLQVRQCLIVPGVVMGSVNLDIELGFGDSDIDRFKAVTFFEFCANTFLFEQKVEWKGMLGGSIPFVLHFLLAGNAKSELKMFQRIGGYPFVDGLLAIAARPVDDKVFHRMGFEPIKRKKLNN